MMSAGVAICHCLIPYAVHLTTRAWSAARHRRAVKPRAAVIR
jgi:hypothetical protein